jgi:hypothetical protein
MPLTGTSGSVAGLGGRPTRSTRPGTPADIEQTLDGLSTTHADQLETLMTLNFQQFKDVSLMAV